MTKHAHEPGNGRCRFCLRDLFQHGYGDVPYCDACCRMLRRHPGVDPATMRNVRTERLPQEQPWSDPTWATDAACADMPPEWFEYRKLSTDVLPAEIQQAAELFCAHCPILARCRSEADTHEMVGLWGGQWRRYTDRTYGYVVRDLLAELETVA